MGQPCHWAAGQGPAMPRFSDQMAPRHPVSYLLDHLGCLQIPPIENLLVAVHPDLSQAHLVARDDTGALGEGVGTLGTEHVAYHRAGDDLQLAPTLPHLTQKTSRLDDKLPQAVLSTSQNARPQVLGRK